MSRLVYFTPAYVTYSLMLQDEMRESHDSLPVLTVMSLTFDARPVVLYNSLGHTRQTVVRLHVNTPHLELRDSLDSIMNTQVNPVLTDSGAVPGVFEVSYDKKYQHICILLYEENIFSSIFVMTLLVFIMQTHANSCKRINSYYKQHVQLGKSLLCYIET